MSSPSFTEQLRDAAGDQWNRVINHKFTIELANGSINKEVLKKYLIQDHRFLDAFVILLASTIAKCRCLEDRIQGCQFLGLITGKENTYFERSFEVLGCSNIEERMKIPNETVTTNFVQLMKTTAKEGSLGEMLSVLVVAEWSYLSWGEQVLDRTNREVDFTTWEWVGALCFVYYLMIAHMHALSQLNSDFQYTYSRPSFWRLLHIRCCLLERFAR